jgi:RNA polymerase sigma factor (sigma-70 family)
MNDAYDDSHIWEAMKHATNDDQRKQLAAEAVEMHMGFIRQYARQTASRAWTDDQRAEYVQELCADAMVRAMSYDPTRTGDSGRTATFPTFLRRHFRSIRWGIDAAAQPIMVSRETIRYRVAVTYFVREFEAQHGRRPTEVEVAGFLTEKRGNRRTIGAVRAGRIMDPPQVVYPDKHVRSEEGPISDLWDVVTYSSSSDDEVGEALVQAEEATARREVVRHLLEHVSLNEMEKVLMVERVMAPPREIHDGEILHPGPLSLVEVGRRFGVSSERARVVERRLLEKLRAELRRVGYVECSECGADCGCPGGDQPELPFAA